MKTKADARAALPLNDVSTAKIKKYNMTLSPFLGTQTSLLSKRR